VITQRARGADLFVVGGWRYLTKPKIVSAKHISKVADLRGKKIGLRELGTLTDRLISFKLLQAGVDPRNEVQWVQHPAFAYSMTSEHADMLRTGQVDAIQTSGKYLDELLREGYPLLIDGDAPERRGRPGRVIVATRQVVEQREAELSAFLRGNVRAHWVWSDPDQFEYVFGAETRMRGNYTHNEDERRVRVVKKAPEPADSLMPLDGKADARGMQAAIEEMLTLGEIAERLDAAEFVRGDFMERAFAELCLRPSLKDAVAKILPYVSSGGR
jgi:ABC-type nitrate/sulfonate/bicarbonate transport system substrate-binding protein